MNIVSIKTLEYITEPNKPFKRSFSLAEQKALHNKFPLFKCSKIDQEGRIYLNAGDEDFSHSYITENDLRLIMMNHNNKISFTQLYNTLGEKQLDLLSRMKNSSKCNIYVTYIKGIINKELYIDDEKLNFSIKEINTIISKGLFKIKSIYPLYNQFQVLNCKLTKFNFQIFNNA